METSTRVQAARRRFTVEEYHRMGEAGILRQDERLELIEGYIVQMNPIGSRHAACVKVLTRLLGRSLGDDLLLDIQNPVRLHAVVEPQPDLAVVWLRDYRESLPGPEDVLFAVEVSDTTLGYDRNVKLPLYGRAGIAEKLDRGPPKRGHRTPQRPLRGRLPPHGAGRPGTLAYL